MELLIFNLRWLKGNQDMLMISVYKSVKIEHSTETNC